MIRKLLQVACLVGVAVAVPALAQNLTEAEYQEKLQALQQNIQKLQQQLDAVKGNREDLLRDLEENETEIGELLDKIENIKQQLKSEEQALQQLRDKRRRLAGEQVAQKKHVARQVRAAYLLGGQSNLKLLLNQNSPQTVSRMLKYHDYFLTAHTDKITTYLNTIEQLNGLEPRILRNTQSLQRSRAQLQSRHRELETRRAEREQLLAKLNETIQNKDQELRQLTRDREHIEKLMDEIVASVGDRGNFNRNAPFADLRGRLPWPAEGRIAHRFGSDRIAGKMKWDGVVIRAAEGTPVTAIHHGRVVFAEYLRGHGLLIIVDHGDGYMSLYAHNQSLKKKVGSWVEAGEVIARVGSSGGQSGAGLYFEIRRDGQPTNPGGWCG